MNEHVVSSGAGRHPDTYVSFPGPLNKNLSKDLLASISTETVGIGCTNGSTGDEPVAIGESEIEDDDVDDAARDEATNGTAE